jgi:diguanylate cyclase (GGDEF)-like protein
LRIEISFAVGPFAVGKTGNWRDWVKDATRLRQEKRADVCLQPAWIQHLPALCAMRLAVLCFSLLSWALSPANAASANELHDNLPTLTTALQAHGLTSEEAKRAYPVHLRAVVTYYDPNFGNGFAALFVNDDTGSIWVDLPANTIASLPVGTLVDVTGVSSNGLFAPVVASPHVRVIGRSHLPEKAARMNHSSLFSGVSDGQWVEVEGTVHSASETDRGVTLNLEMPDGAINVLMMREAGADYSRLVDAVVQIRGNAAPIFSRTKYGMVGVRLMAPGLSTVKVLEPAPLDPFKQPVVPVDSLMRWDHISILKHRVHLRGTVTLLWPGSSLCIRDESGTICTQTREQTPIAVGDIADVIGFAGIAGEAHILTDVVYRPGGKGKPAVATPMVADDILQGLYDSELIVIDGQLIGRDQASTDTTLMLSAGKVIFTAILPNGLADSKKDEWKTGSRLRITGICSVRVNAESSAAGGGVSEEEGLTVAKSFRVLMRSPSDIVVLQKASWWTPAHAILLLTLALIATLGVLGWVAALRRRIEQQAILLRESEGQFRHMALHDALTGLATRLLLQDRLNVALENAKRHGTGLAVLMLDLDQFKVINDTHGHQTGDEVLRVTADRVLRAVRRVDTVARLGGDEFVVLLPDLADPKAAERIAAKIVEALTVPIPFAGREVQVSISIGICAVAAGELDADALLRNADAALYQAKASGRNRFQLFEPEVAATQTK